MKIDINTPQSLRDSSPNFIQESTFRDIKRYTTSNLTPSVTT